MGFLGYFLKERHLKDILAKKKHYGATYLRDTSPTLI